MPVVQKRAINTKTRHYGPPGSNSRPEDDPNPGPALQRRFKELESEVLENQQFLVSLPDCCLPLFKLLLP